MIRGFVKLPRAFYESPVWNHAEALSRAEAFIEMYRRAAFRSDKILVAGQKVEVNPFQFVAKSTTLAESWRWTPEMVDAYLAEMNSQGFIRWRQQHGVNYVTVSDFGDNEHFARYFGSRPDVLRGPVS